MAQTKLYRYKPAGHRTPGHHKTIGHLEYGEVYDHPDCEGNPDFEEVKTTAKSSTRKGSGRASQPRRPKVHDTAPKPAPNPSPVSEAEPGTPENPDLHEPITGPDAPHPPAAPADADTGKEQ